MRNKYQKELPENIRELCDEIFKRFQMELDWGMICSNSREAEIVFKRAIVCHILRYCGYSYPSIGSAVNRDHATALYLINIYPNNIKNSIWRAKFSGIIKFINTRLNVHGVVDFSGLSDNSIARQINYHLSEIIRLKKLLPDLKINITDAMSATDKGKWAKLLE